MGSIVGPFSLGGSARLVVPNPSEAAVFVNGEKVDELNGVELSHGDRICVVVSAR